MKVFSDDVQLTNICFVTVLSQRGSFLQVFVKCVQSWSAVQSSNIKCHLLHAAEVDYHKTDNFMFTIKLASQ